MQSTVLVRITSYPYRLWALSIICLVFLVALPAPSFAQSININATVPAPLPNPIGQTHFTSPSITLRGICPTNGAYVIIQRNMTPVGVAPCQSSQFSLAISLVTGQNNSTAHVYNITDNPGPVPDDTVLYYEPPLSPTTKNEEEQSNANASSLLPSGFPLTQPNSICSTQPITLTHQYRYQTRKQGEQWQWDMTAHQGCPPYRAFIDWGDGNKESREIKESGSFVLKHRFEKAGTFAPRVEIRDTTGALATFQLLAIINPLPANKGVPTKKDETLELSFYSLVGLGIVGVSATVVVAQTAIRGRFKRP
jgi:hypothetical protein